MLQESKTVVEPALKERLVARARLYQRVRQFFAKRHVMEVETPLLAKYTVTEPNITSFSVRTRHPAYLQTSPEYAMKRLLVAGSGCIYQICKAFRQEELGAYHREEFSLLEWYRVGYDHHQLMAEADSLLQETLGCAPAEKMTYQRCFEHYLGVDPMQACLKQLDRVLALHLGDYEADWLADQTTALQTLFATVIQPQLGQHSAPCIIYHFPMQQAALSRIDQDVACRFEIYWRGCELANGFFELADADEQLSRFRDDNARRRARGQEEIAIDHEFIAALADGLPECSGIALGLDRLLMLQQQWPHIATTMSLHPNQY